ncbi:MAG: non-canonical purine NTP pyrophosphatase, RdgB/HAM1 family [Bacteroidetes bacterium 4572_128]|nr:MAG: non-canonical purine NTP pyrophosphatase, RdgB/HAM1 family [Bacteroidetes bacterium 4572_128]
MKLIFASHNINKCLEIKTFLKNEFEVFSLGEIGIYEDIPEPYDTFVENALSKARYVYNKFNINCFADDSGLEVDFLKGKPGVLSARYSGEDKNDEKNIQKVLKDLNSIKNRNAKFKTVIALIFNGKEYIFEGVIKGIILDKKIGKRNFGYDPIFKPDGFEKSFSQMTLEEKNKISHRTIAIKKMKNFLF